MPYSLGTYNFQYARTGNAYSGLFTYWTEAFINPYPWIREFIGIYLQAPLQVGETYYFTMYVSLASWNNSPCASNRIGLKLTTQSYAAYGNIFTSPLVTNSASFYVDTLITDTVNWVEVSTSLIADSAYEYLVIGNFFDDNNTDTVIMGTAPFCYGYYFIDDVCLSLDSNCLSTEVEPPHLQITSISPNPFTTSTTITLNSSTPPLTIQLFDATGREAPLQYHTAQQTNRTVLILDRGGLQAGVYFLVVTTQDKREVARVVAE